MKRRDVEILWTQLDPPPTLELIDAIQAAIKSQQDGHLGPYAVIEEIANAVNHYVNGVD